jgi:hypothetical protein
MFLAAAMGSANLDHLEFDSGDDGRPFRAGLGAPAAAYRGALCCHSAASVARHSMGFARGLHGLSPILETRSRFRKTRMNVTGIKKTNYREQEFQPSLQIFIAQRAGLLTLLRPLAAEAWSRTATVTGAGKLLERTVYTYAHRLATHERTHIKQIERIVNFL